MFAYKNRIAAALAIAALSSGSAIAATATSTLNVSTTVAGSCTVTANELAFTAASIIDGNAIDGQTTIDVTCTNGTAYNVGLDGGSSGDVAARTMVHAAVETATLDYQLYTNSARTTAWGNTVGTDTVEGAGSGAAQSLTVYGQIKAGQADALAGDYTDAVQVTVTY